MSSQIGRASLVALAVGRSPAESEAFALDRAGYLSIADRLQPQLDLRWAERAGRLTRCTARPRRQFADAVHRSTSRRVLGCFCAPRS